MKKISFIIQMNQIKIYILIIFFIFSLLYFPQTLLMNESVDTIAAFEIDASLMIDSVFQHLNTYNFQLGYMSRYYGWSYFFINYLILKPINILENILGIYNITFNIFLIKIIFFLISVTSCILLFLLLKKIFKKNIIAFVGSLFYILYPLKHTLFTDIKPETTGFLFLFLAQIFLINFIENNNKKRYLWYYFSIICLTLSALAKQSFVFLIFPSLFIFYLYYIKKNRLNFIKNIFSPNTLKTIIYSIFLVLMVTFIIYPHLLLHPLNFINSQKVLFNDHAGSNPLVLKGEKLFQTWKLTIWNNLFLKIVICSFPISILTTIISKNLLLKRFLIVSYISVPFLVYVFCKNAGLFITPNYLAPLFSIFTIIILFPLSKAISIKNKILKKLILIFYIFLFLMYFSFNFLDIHTTLENRKNYKQSDTILLSNYISKEIPKNSKIAISDGVLIPKDNSETIYMTCHWWQDCNSKLYLEQFKPDYFIFIKDTSFNGIQPDYYLNYINYIYNNKFDLKTNIGRYVIYKNSQFN